MRGIEILADNVDYLKPWGRLGLTAQHRRNHEWKSTNHDGAAAC